MKKVLYTFSLLAFSLNSMAQVGINNPSPHASAQLDITATDKGILIPRMTVTERMNIPNPAEGLMVFQTGVNAGFYYYSQNEWHYNKPAAIGPVSYFPDPKGAAIDMNGNIVLTPADGLNSGIVTPGFQYFGGDKVFQNEVTIQGSTSVNAALTVLNNTQLNSNLTVNNNVMIGNELNVVGNVSTTSSFIGKGAITYITGPINTANYSNGNVVFAQDEGAFYFFKAAVASQSSASWNNAAFGFAEAPYGDHRHIVMRFSPTGTAIQTIKLDNGPTTNTVLSLYAGVLPCTDYVQVNPATLIASSSLTNNGEYQFPANTLIPGTDYFLQFTSNPPSGFGVNNLPDPNFGSSYGQCDLNVGVPAMQIVYKSFIKL